MVRNTLVLFMIIFSIDTSLGKVKLVSSNNTNETAIQLNKKNIEKNKLEIKKYSDKNKELSEEIKSSKQLIHLLEYELSEQGKTISSIKSFNQSSSKNSYIGAIILILGLFIEIVGAIFLSTPTLSEKLKEVRKLEVKGPIYDLNLTPTSNHSLIAMITTIGGLLLLVGFLFQVFGTAIILPYPWELKIAGVFFILLTAFATLYFVFGLSGIEQSRKEKFKHIYTFIIYAIIKPLFRQTDTLCDYCRRSVDDPYISYQFDPSHIYNPNLFQFGHKECLEKQVYEYCHENFPDPIIRGPQEKSFKILPAHDFVNTDYSILEQWHLEKPKRLNSVSFKELKKMFSRAKKS